MTATTTGTRSTPTTAGDGRGWLLLGAVAGIGALALVTVARVLTAWPEHLWLGLASSAAVGIVAAAAGRRRRGPDLTDLVVQLGGVVGALLVLVVGFVVLVVGLGRIPEEDERGLVTLTLLAAGLGAVAFAPVRHAAARRLRASLHREVEDPAAVLRLFGSRIRRDLPLDEVLLQVAETLRRTMNLDTAEVWTGGPDVFQRRVAVPDQPAARATVDLDAHGVAAKTPVAGQAWMRVWTPALLAGRSSSVRLVPLGFSGALLGFVIVERAQPDLTGAEEHVLAELGRQVGLALHNAQLDDALQESLDEVRRQARELEASRRRLVSAADEERRRIERNLHDGAQQHLVALSVGLNLAKDVIGADADAAAEMLGQLQESIQETIEELRALAHGIYPPLLRDSGLRAALRAAAARSPLQVEVVGDDIPRVAADIEAAVYFCCLEALQNAAKHAPDAQVTVSLHEREGGVLFEVTDDGPGFDPASIVTSAGFTNMADRVGAVGGRVDWETAPGEGVTVRGGIPLGPTG